MAEVVNLRQFRKRKQRDEKEARAEANRQSYGVSSKIKKLHSAKKDIEARKLDGNKLTPDEE